MDATLTSQLAKTISAERQRLYGFIRRRVLHAAEAEDILQDVFYELVEAYRLPEPIEQVGAWLYRVARNRIIDWGRKKKLEPLPMGPEEGDEPWRDLDAVLPAMAATPLTLYVKNILFEEIEAALDELPFEQRSVFIDHELHGKSFKELAAQSGVSINTLLARKRYAVLYLRERLSAVYEELIELTREENP